MPPAPVAAIADRHRRAAAALSPLAPGIIALMVVIAGCCRPYCCPCSSQCCPTARQSVGGGARARSIPPPSPPSPSPNIFGSHAPGLIPGTPLYDHAPKWMTDDTTNYLFVGTTTVVICSGSASRAERWPGAATASSPSGLHWRCCLPEGIHRSIRSCSSICPIAFFRRPSDAMFVACILIALICGQL